MAGVAARPGPPTAPHPSPSCLPGSTEAGQGPATSTGELIFCSISFLLIFEERQNAAGGAATTTIKGQRSSFKALGEKEESYKRCSQPA